MEEVENKNIHDSTTCHCCQFNQAQHQGIFDQLANEHGLSPAERRLYAQEINDFVGFNLS